jgi:putative spermidine/putrescine transport system permease protein
MFFVAVKLGLIGNAIVLASAHAVIGIPAVVVVVSATLKGFDESLEHASMSLGANRWQTFLYVTLPLIRPGVLTAGLFAFLISFDDLLMRSEQS